jgi:sugar/nucleoside kinase (ribokinase family)
MNTPIDTVCVGDIMAEYILDFPSLPPVNGTLVVDSHSKEIGGPAFNICWYLSQFGIPPLLVGLFGKRDRLLIANSISSSNLSDSGLISFEGETDLIIIMLSGHHHHSVYFRTHLPEEVGAEILARCDHPKRLILTGSRHFVIRRSFIDLAEKFNGNILAFNPSYAIYEYDKEELTTLLLSANIIIMNQNEAEYACKIFGLYDLGHLSENVPGCLILTLGGKGSTSL